MARMGLEGGGTEHVLLVSEGGRDRTPNICNIVTAQAPVYARGTPAHVRRWMEGRQDSFDNQTLFSNKLSNLKDLKQTKKLLPSHSHSDLWPRDRNCHLLLGVS